MCICIHYTTGSDNTTFIINKQYNETIKKGVLQLAHLGANTRYEFCLTILENCNDDAIIVGWAINGSFVTEGECIFKKCFAINNLSYMYSYW